MLRRIWLPTIGNLFFFFAVTLFFTLPVYLEGLGAQRAEVGRVMGSFGATSVVAIPLTGSLVDRYGPRRFMLVGAGLWALVAIGFVASSGLGAIVYVLRLGQGIAFAMAFVATNALVISLSPPGALARSIAIFGTTTLSMHALGPWLGEVIVNRFGWPTMFAVSAVSALISVGCFLSVRPPDRPVGTGALGYGFMRTMHRSTYAVLVAGLTMAIGFGCAMNFIPLFVRARGLTSHAPFFVAYVVAAVSVRLLFGGVADRFGRRRSGLAAGIVFVASVAAFGMVRSPLALVAVALGFGLAHGVGYPALNAVFVAATPSSAHGKATSLFNLSFNVGVTVAAFLGGAIAQAFDYATMWLVAAAIGLLGFGVLAVARPAVTEA